jgi:hypothetical protein
MDAAGIYVQVLSLTSPGAEQLEATDAGALARSSNDCLANAVRTYPTRLAGFRLVFCDASGRGFCCYHHAGLSLDRPPRLRQGFLDAVALERTLKSTRDVYV